MTPKERSIALGKLKSRFAHLPFPDKFARITHLLLVHLNHEKWVCWPSRKLLAKKADCSEKTVQRNLAAIVELGLFHKRRLGSTAMAELQRQLGKKRRTADKHLYCVYELNFEHPLWNGEGIDEAREIIRRHAHAGIDARSTRKKRPEDVATDPASKGPSLSIGTVLGTGPSLLSGTGPSLSNRDGTDSGTYSKETESPDVVSVSFESQWPCPPATLIRKSDTEIERGSPQQTASTDGSLKGGSAPSFAALDTPITNQGEKEHEVVGELDRLRRVADEVRPSVNHVADQVAGFADVALRPAAHGDEGQRPSKYDVDAARSSFDRHVERRARAKSSPSAESSPTPTSKPFVSTGDAELDSALRSLDLNVTSEPEVLVNPFARPPRTEAEIQREVEALKKRIRGPLFC